MVCFKGLMNDCGIVVERIADVVLAQIIEIDFCLGFSVFLFVGFVLLLNLVAPRYIEFLE